MSYPFVWVHDGALSAKFCKQVIKKFEADPRKKQGVTGSGYRPDLKRSTDLQITGLAEWEKEDAVFFDALGKYIPEYQKHLVNSLSLDTPNVPIFGSDDVKDLGYQVQKTMPGEEYVWHNDSCMKDGYARALTYIWYLNDVSDGETEFYDGSMVKPVQGRMVLFPATWTFMHRGREPKSAKYIVTGWMVSKQRI